MSFYGSIGKKPIRLYKDIPGHVANRLQAALYREILYLVQEGVLSVESRGYRGVLWSRASLGRDGAESAVASRRRRQAVSIISWNI